jgi:hypothetical protein
MKKIETKMELMAIVDRIPEEKIPMVAEILESLAFYTEVHDDDEPIDDIEREAIKIGLQEEADNKTIPIEEIKKKYGL